jgi:hypothetical protein
MFTDCNYSIGELTYVLLIAIFFTGLFNDAFNILNCLAPDYRMTSNTELNVWKEEVMAYCKCFFTEFTTTLSLDRD